MSRILHRAPGETLPIAVGGAGVHLIDRDGRRYIDASGGAAVSCLGHGHPDVIAAIKVQLDKLAYAHTAFFTTEAMETLADKLIATAPSGLDRALFVSGGSEGIEAALKLARQYFVELDQPERAHVIARRQSYHGATLGALSVGGHEARRALFAPLLFDATHVSPCHGYRGKQAGESDDGYARRLADELEAAIQRLGPNKVAAFIAETVVGATLGVAPPVQGYFKRVREVCDRHGVILILDEVMCGMGRTGTRHACEQEGVAPDLLVLAKGLGAGYQPIGAVLISKGIADAIVEGTGAFRHSHTYMGHATASAAALAVQETIERDHLLDEVRARGAELGEALSLRFGQHPHVGDVRGRGLFYGIELVKERDTKQPFDPKLGLNARIKRQAMAGGLLCYPGGGTADGIAGDHVLLAPPFIATSDDIQQIVDSLSGAVERALAEIQQ
ncbi:MAG: aspartate aminotransferase family protein [Alphaproteobacteria bacterium]|nr:aspartate aminotransferase family protein [Alphaproteobacteria bacterium]